MTKTRWMVFLAVFGITSAITLQTSAQQGPAPGGVIRINVNLVQVDAVVTDSQGRPVTDLQAEDFELFQDGEPQKITNVEFINIKRTDPAAAPVTVQSKNGVAPPPPQTKLLRRDDIRRTIALVVDDTALSFDSSVRVRDSLKKWVDNEMQEGDLVAVIRTSASDHSFQRFTMDKQALLAAVERVQYRLGRVGVSSFQASGPPQPTDGILNTAFFEDAVEHAYLVGSLNAIQHVVRGVRDLPGRKSVIVFSEDMRFTYIESPTGIPSEQYTNATSEERLRKLADEASRSSVVIYAVDPRGVVHTGLTAEDTGGAIDETGAVTGDKSGVPSSRTQQVIASRDGMIELSHRTGGLFVGDNNNMGEVLRRAVDDGDGYYLVSYQPSELTFDDASGQAVFHKISLRVKRPGLNVRSRAGFYGRPDNNPALTSLPRQVQLASALASPFASEDIGIRLTGLFFPSNSGESTIKALLHFDAKALNFTEEPDGARTAEIDVATVAFNAEGQQLSTEGTTSKIRVPQTAIEGVLKNGLVYSTQVNVEKAGGYELRVVLRDTSNMRLGSAMQFIDVPDLRNGRLALSGIVLAGIRTSSVVNTGGELPESPNEGTPALRVFREGSAIAYSYQILNARTDDSKQPQLEEQLRVFRNGEQVLEGKQRTLTPAGKLSNPKHLVVQGTARLQTLTPGQYVLQVVVADNNRFDRYRVATQSIDFEVQP